MLALARHELIARRVLINTALPDQLPHVVGDRVQLQQVLLNLVVNAMDAMSTVAQEARELRISVGYEAGCGVVRVRDAGVGFAPHEGERLFDPFYSTKSDGMGMGLAICRSIVHAHGGRLWAELNAESGATFILDLPVAPDTAH